MRLTHHPLSTANDRRVAAVGACASQAGRPMKVAGIASGPEVAS